MHDVMKNPFQGTRMDKYFANLRNLLHYNVHLTATT